MYISTNGLLCLRVQVMYFVVKIFFYRILNSNLKENDCSYSGLMPTLYYHLVLIWGSKPTLTVGFGHR